MPRTASTMLALGTAAPAFALPDVVTGKIVASAAFNSAKALLVVFASPHCPFVQHVQQELAQIERDYTPLGLSIVGISANDPAQYPEDAPEKVKEFVQTVGLSFPFLFDQNQDVAKSYRAACTPDFFLFDADRKLAYRGQLDESRPGNDIPVTGQDLRNAIVAILTGQPVSEVQKPSIGCNIKWKPGNEPDYYSTPTPLTATQA